MGKTLLHSSDWMAVNQADEKTVEIDITGYIGARSYYDDSQDITNINNTREKMKAELKALSELKAEKIIVNIDSLGGDIGHGVSIYDMLIQHPAQIETKAAGMVASIATVIYQAGNIRKMSDNALMLFHRGMFGIMGMFNQIELRSMADDLNKFDDRIMNIYEKRSGKSRAEIEELMNINGGNGKWIDGTEVLALNLTDEIYEPTKRAAASYDKKLFNQLKYPEIPINMTKADETVSLWEKMKEAFNLIFVTADNKAEIPQDVTDKLTAFGKQLDELKAENTTLSTDLESVKNEVTAKDAKITELTGLMETQKTEYEKKAKEATDLVTELRSRVSKWEPAGRKQGDNGQNKVDGIDLNKVKEIQEKIK